MESDTAQSPGAATRATQSAGPRAVLVTGARGAIGRGFVRALAGDRRGITTLVALDVRETPEAERVPGVLHRTLDVRDPALADLVAANAIDCVVHLAAIVSPPRGMSRAEQRAIDVGGTENVLAACVRHGVRQLVVTSSGAAYGYHPDNAPLLDEDAPLRGNPEFAYSDHKRQVEELLAHHRAEHPALGQLVLRLGTVLGAGVANQITALFDKPVILGVGGAATPWVFVWDDDVIAILLEGVHEAKTGIYNVAGDGVMTMREIASALGKPFIAPPAPLLARALTLLHARGLTQYGPEQVMFLRHRPVLSNERLKREFGYRPRWSSRQAFDRFLTARGDRPLPHAPSGAMGRVMRLGVPLAERTADRVWRVLRAITPREAGSDG